ncbi:hypothetical protein GBZ48_22420 [Azospirillum melinis]|uniref:Polysaccharide biosynthesis enzyme WcbI domain-containing protein n=1 Tax=Azospirillum melinis TaxID=328839 RepID=A0ABX2KH25_9PROT|nr:WcbI family polysaccharide biosynthesis putative acetyltransferase [Azospirillum melinis]MBP2310162.1 hypothetical protein [Azospirillum melinis]NUB02008.1 hypothetical protein [Azospirillum melinis]
MLNVLIYANCQGGAIAKFIAPIIAERFNVSIKHRNSYESVLLYRESGYTGEEVPEDFREDIRQADIFIYQPLKRKYGVLSTDRDIQSSVVNLISSKCMTISVPYAYNTALWPIFADDKAMKANNYLIMASKEASSFSDIENLYWKGHLDFEFDERMSRTMRLLREREEICDVKISDFVSQNISEKRLFLTHNHPSNALFSEISNQVLRMISERYIIGFSEAEIENICGRYFENYAELPGYYPVSRHAIDFFKFSYQREPDKGADEFYLSYLKALYNIVNRKIGTIPKPWDFPH